MPEFYRVDGFKIYSHLDTETTEKFFNEIKSRGLLPPVDQIKKYASLHKMEFDGTSWSVAIMHSESTIFIDRIVRERYNPRKE
jgi:hypothetical protein